MHNDHRPLSPHLQVYRWQLTSVLSIAHRVSGLALVAAALAFAGWLLAVAAGPGAYAQAQALFASWLGRACLLVFTFSLFYHLANGIRHLFWDAGLGFELEQVYRSGYAVVIASALLTLAAWVAGYAMRGAG